MLEIEKNMQVLVTLLKTTTINSVEHWVGNN